jgi:hypothetical protein
MKASRNFTFTINSALWNLHEKEIFGSNCNVGDLTFSRQWPCIFLYSEILLHIVSLCTEDGGSRVLRNAVEYLPHYTTSQPRGYKNFSSRIFCWRKIRTIRGQGQAYNCNITSLYCYLKFSEHFYVCMFVLFSYHLHWWFKILWRSLLHS